MMMRAKLGGFLSGVNVPGQGNSDPVSREI